MTEQSYTLEEDVGTMNFVEVTRLLAALQTLSRIQVKFLLLIHNNRVENGLKSVSSQCWLLEASSADRKSPCQLGHH